MENLQARFHDLPLSGQLVVWASRHWLRAYSDGRMIPRCVWQSFAEAELLPAYHALISALAVVAGHELDPRSFAAPNAPRLTAEEACWVRLVLADDASCWPSGNEPCPAISRVACEHLRAVASCFVDAGFKAGLPAIAPGIPLPRNTLPGARLGAAAVH